MGCSSSWAWSLTRPGSGGSVVFSILTELVSVARCTTSCPACFGVRLRSTSRAKLISRLKRIESLGCNSVPSKIIFIAARISWPSPTPQNQLSRAYASRPPLISAVWIDTRSTPCWRHCCVSVRLAVIHKSSEGKWSPSVDQQDPH